MAGLLHRLASYKLRWRVVLPLSMTAAILAHTFWHFPLPSPDVDVLAILEATPQHLAHYVYTEHKPIPATPEEITDAGMASIGTPPGTVVMDNADILDERTLEPMEEGLERTAFNLAILPLPEGSLWGYVGVARGPLRRRGFMKVNGHDSIEHVMIAFGLNYTAKGGLFAVTKAQTLDIQNIPHEACESHGPFVATYGAEDARLFYTDAGTPGMTFARQSDDPKTCRVVGFVPDLRAIYAPLAAAWRGGMPFNATHTPGRTPSYELRRTDFVRETEKNWAPFFPGALPNGDLFPHMSYGIAGIQLLQPANSTLRRIDYAPMHYDDELSKCVMKMHAGWPPSWLHQATPWYRLTLGKRGRIMPTVGNTVLFTIVHAKTPRGYVKIVLTFEVDAPHRILSVGPGWGITDLTDWYGQINFSLALAPLPSPDAPRQRKRDPWLPSHFFLDDDVLYTLGHMDSSMMFSVIKMEDLITRQRRCARPVEEA